LIAFGGCFSPPPLNLPDASVIGFDGQHAVPPNCTQLIEPALLVDAGRARPGVAFGCATYTNLAAMLARPADVVAPLPYAGADAALAASAVRRYDEDRVATPTPAKPTTTSITP
jgi:type IV pilus biogenesis protein CpaD/CtpE